MKIRTVILDDEPLAIDVIKNYCDTMPDIELLGCFTNPVEAMKFVTSKTVDLIFLDIEMPLLTGIEFIDTLKIRPQFIFTTAYPQFAIDGFELEALDYLVKPIAYTRFLKSVNKFTYQASKNENKKQPLIVQKQELSDKFLFVKSDYESLKIFIDDIKYIEGLKDYLKINLNSGKSVLTLSNFKNLLEKLPEQNFMRVHNSYIVNLQYINSIQRNRIIIDQKRIPISETYKKLFFERIKL
ncbi:DNA-binding LytR/AlgR family response regulator [Flavobacterium gossypii]|jgi:Response regulator of the LytR/AlgR family|uniref:DNA-binding LytR/AlgR family response regulator n=2 Tax=Flavobacterium TaxID=237 RepID=A0A495LXN1_9FLAO|nr:MULTISPECIES: LytTR family DNA-binding domain-containing protein [Flavobacterium]MBA9071907.1 DNA-binding LytR/AlgR family response regulator [Flavobacterium gossypii]RKS17888.1 DNA-binding LytR/AlgR family response regulator [Flavobacterium endophyticum]WDO12406.1 LytTR family DNA-binding domain-containing protein [Flavobacterium sp. WW92]